MRPCVGLDRAEPRVRRLGASRAREALVALERVNGTGVERHPAAAAGRYNPRSAQTHPGVLAQQGSPHCVVDYTIFANPDGFCPANANGGVFERSAKTTQMPCVQSEPTP